MRGVALLALIALVGCDEGRGRYAMAPAGDVRVAKLLEGLESTTAWVWRLDTVTGEIELCRYLKGPYSPEGKPYLSCSK